MRDRLTATSSQLAKGTSMPPARVDFPDKTIQVNFSNINILGIHTEVADQTCMVNRIQELLSQWLWKEN